MSTDYSEIEDIEQKIFEISEKDIYKFSSDFPKGTNQGIPNHYHVCVKVSNCYIIFNCCTSQSGKVHDRIRFLGRTYVPVTNSKKTHFTQPTFIDCDNVFTMTPEEFDRFSKEDKITFSGLLSGNDYREVVKGILSSDLVEQEIKDLFMSHPSGTQ